ncbi:MAG: cytochrome c [Saprospiraceae bacterium]|jgi:glucose/arabinose dehydrogenase/cytochrome c551/c552
MKFNFLFAIISCLIITSCSDDKRIGDAKILLFTKTAGYHHDCIANGGKAITKMCAENNIQVESTTDPSFFNEQDLADYAAVVFFNTTGDVLNGVQENAFERYIQSGGGYAGVHAASDTEYDWEWYGKLAGASFISHPVIQEAKFVIQDSSFAATSFLPVEWIRTDELYNLKMLNSDVNVLLTVDESTYEGGENGDNHPMAWYHEYDGGRSFYTALGHTQESYKEDFFMKHLLEGIKYAIGDNERLDYSKAKTPAHISSDRFSKVALSAGQFDEPTEMTILPNLDVLIAERGGDLKLYKADSKKLLDAGVLDVYDDTGIEEVNAEEGFMGLQADPYFAENNWIYTFYAPIGELAVNRLSRFKFVNDKLKMDSEQVILDVASDRQICCHTGGSIAFGPDGLLYLSTGDNSTPFDEPDVDYVNNGYAPLNDLPGKKQYDARRSSGNTNDLRGKILRINVEEDGSYSIPEGNLFPVGTERTRPEIYTMGHRNPYRISVDPHKGYVYWGDVGPDAQDDKKERGPKGYDEMGQARKAGNFGWPLFIGDNKPYIDYDYSTGKSGRAFNPAAPINDSKNNTGLRELPPAQGAFVYYPYDKSSDFAGLQSGSRNAMAGPTYYFDDYIGDKKLPEAYNEKVFIYDWMRGWMKAVTLNADGSYSRMEPFASDVKLNNLIDMEIGPNGQMYLLEYGTGWFVQNDDSGLSVIEYNQGNRAPKIKEFSANVSSGKSPLTVELSVEAEDPENENMTYSWNFGYEEVKTTKEPKVSYTYSKPGMYKATVDVLDKEGLVTTSGIVNIVCGNTRPMISIDLKGLDTSTYKSNLPVSYKVNVKDEEDGQEIDLSKIYVSVDYVDGYDEASVSTGHQEVSDVSLGESLVKTSICRSCHKVNETSIGPSYTKIADKYKSDWNSTGYLRSKIINGGTGVWGENVMPANSEAKPADVKKMIKYILSLADEEEKDRMAPQGTITPAKNSEGKVMVVTATYTDKGAEGSHPLTATSKAVLRSDQKSGN